ncbi:hypothetical protein ACFL1N_04490 [Thermodesulfobacteriota bacterium]
MQVYFNNIMAGVIIAYVFFSGMGQLLLAMLLGIILICLMSATFRPGILSLKSLFFRFFTACCIAICLSLSKLIATLSFLSHFPRSDYPLPGFTDISDLLIVLGKSLFLHPAHELSKRAIVDMKWLLDRHEFEFGITIVPLFLLCIGLIYQTSKIRINKWKCLDSRKALLFFLCLLICTIPIALNYYTPAWNQFLKSIPILKSSGQYIRWFILYIPGIILLTAIIVERTPFLMKNQILLSVLGIFAVIMFNTFSDKTFYHEQSYDPAEILQAYQETRNHKWTPGITNISICTDESGNILFHQNDSLTKGYSQLFCYDPIFGYRLENFPRKNLSPGPVLEDKDGFLNLKNPACYVFPEENNCSPGDHFTKEQRESAAAFASYMPFDFKIPLKQKISNWISLFSLLCVASFIAVYGLFTLWILVYNRYHDKN